MKRHRVSLVGGALEQNVFVRHFSEIPLSVCSRKVNLNLLPTLWSSIERKYNQINPGTKQYLTLIQSSINLPQQSSFNHPLESTESVLI